MDLLLGTHIFLWCLQMDPNLGGLARAAISNPKTTVWVSAACFWEISIKHSAGRLQLDDPPGIYLPLGLEQSGFRELPITLRHALAVGELPIGSWSPKPASNV